MAKRFWTDFRGFFLRGLAAVLPTLLTVMIIIYVFRFVQDKIGNYINTGVIYLLAELQTTWSIDDLEKTWDDNWYLQGVGFVLAIIGIYFIGRFVASFVGRGAWGMVERALTRTPVIKQIYPNLKQVTDFFFSEHKLEFSRVVAVEYPRKGVWSVGLVTGTGMRAMGEALGVDVLTVFVPSSPTPVTGYTITVRRDEVIDLPLSIDEAFRFTVSGGVIIPPAQFLPEPPGRPVTRSALVGRAEQGESEG